MPSQARCATSVKAFGKAFKLEAHLTWLGCPVRNTLVQSVIHLFSSWKDGHDACPAKPGAPPA